MGRKTEISTQEQIEFIERQISFHKIVLATCGDESEVGVAEMKHELDCFNAVRETLLITYGLEGIASQLEMEVANA